MLAINTMDAQWIKPRWCMLHYNYTMSKNYSTRTVFQALTEKSLKNWKGNLRQKSVHDRGRAWWRWPSLPTGRTSCAVPGVTARSVLPGIEASPVVTAWPTVRCINATCAGTASTHWPVWTDWANAKLPSCRDSGCRRGCLNRHWLTPAYLSRCSFHEKNHCKDEPTWSIYHDHV